MGVESWKWSWEDEVYVEEDSRDSVIELVDGEYCVLKWTYDDG
jgi:hypothetical protein